MKAQIGSTEYMCPTRALGDVCFSRLLTRLPHRSQRIASACLLERAGRERAALAPLRSLCRVMQDEYRDVLRWHRLRKQIALRNVASKLAHCRQLLRVLDALGNDRLPKAVRQPRDGVDDGAALGVGHDVCNERAVDLHARDRQ